MGERTRGGLNLFGVDGSHALATAKSVITESSLWGGITASVVHYCKSRPARVRDYLEAENSRLLATLGQCCGPGDVSFEAKRIRHRAVPIQQVPVADVVAAGAG